MGELINGRTPKIIKSGLINMLNSCGDMRGESTRCLQGLCPYYGDDYCEESILIGALALIEHLEATLERLGEFGKLFEEYTGCPRGATGRAALPIEEEVLAMKPIRDVDHGEWIPVNADALRELVAKYKQLRDAVPKEGET